MLQNNPLPGGLNAVELPNDMAQIWVVATDNLGAKSAPFLVDLVAAR